MEDEITLDLRDLLFIIKKRIKLIAGITVGCTIISAAISFYVIKPTYEAKTSIVIGKADSGTSDGAASDKNQYNYNDVMMFQKLVKTYGEIGKSTAVAEKASEKTKNITAAQIQNMLTVTPETDTQIIEFKVKNNDPNQAYNVMNAVSDAFVQEAKRIYPSGNVQIMDSAKVPQKPVKPNKALNIVIGFFLGLMASLGLTFVLEYMDNTLKTEKDINKYLDIPVIGIIPKA